MKTGWKLELGTQQVEWYLGQMGIRRSHSMARVARSAAAVTACFVLANCASSDKFAGRLDPRYGVSNRPGGVAFRGPPPQGGGPHPNRQPPNGAGRGYVAPE